MHFLFPPKQKINEKADYYEYKKHRIAAGQINPLAIRAVRSLRQNNHQAYIVGGCLRDILLGTRPKDFDVATDARPEQVRRTLPGTIIIGRRFKLVHLRKGRNIIEISTFRGADKHFLTRFWSFLKSRHYRYTRQNIFGTIAEDAYRRDITVNALYYDPDKQLLLDYVRAMDDIKNKTARIIGDARKRFIEDPMRIIRVLRFAAKLNLKLAEDIEPAIRELHPRISSLPNARIFDEFLKLFFTGHGRNSYKMLRRFDLLQYFFPSFKKHPSAAAEKVIEHALADSDTRIEKSIHWTPVFLLSVFLWFRYKELLDRPLVSKRRKKKRSEYSLFLERHLRACQEVFAQQRETMPVFLRHRKRIEKIWLMQRSLLRYEHIDTEPVKKDKNLRISYDLLKVLSTGYEEMQPAVEWWQPFVQSTYPASRRRKFQKRGQPFRHRRDGDGREKERNTDRGFSDGL